MRRFLSWSIFAGALAAIGMMIVNAIFYDHLHVNISNFLLIWLAFAVRKGSVTACRWAVFIMCLITVTGLVIVYGFVTNSPFILKGPPGMGSSQLPINLLWTVLFCIWSLVNLVLAIIVLREENENFFSKAATVGVSCFAGFLILIPVLSYLFIPAYARRGQLEQRYAEQLALMRKIASGQMESSRNSSRVMAVFTEHPEIIEAGVGRAENDGYHIIFNATDRNLSGRNMMNTWLGSVGTAQYADGGSIPIVAYRGYARNAQGEWVPIKMTIRDIWTQEG